MNDYMKKYVPDGGVPKVGEYCISNTFYVGAGPLIDQKGDFNSPGAKLNNGGIYGGFKKPQVVIIEPYSLYIVGDHLPVEQARGFSHTKELPCKIPGCKSVDTQKLEVRPSSFQGLEVVIWTSVIPS